ncbi:ABC transporter ATP-binding protein [Williamsia sterculiae]|uniref:Trehalose import ATP-binding protein SugC n=1 Tax=Williamsia sterculiae TaxID=1344003 RepID=A0A1N7GS45_9NOCA|nr:sn-glycerol-3-phosphate ABC transporter ATP-binding protein UgpC [Williamsia sterculiae]SIS15413.1 carbohydrate ABC transporter ATP-binding protein, CUT1 family [Williamsia sterculiae]
MATVSFDAVTRDFGGSRPAVDKLDLEIADGEFLVLVGPSGCGKSTSLRMLAGLEPTQGGRVLIDGQDVTGVAPKARDVAMVFQNYALYPNMTVADNMGFALRNAGMSKSDSRKSVAEAAEMLELTELLDRKPGALSGGQRQRVAMGRAIVRRPKVFCMDEPLSNLDAKLRVSTRGQIAGLQKRLGTTTLYVTHDQVEAMTMGDRVAVLKQGVLQQVASPRELYLDPVNTFVAGFMGSPSMNLFDEVTVVDRSATLGGHRITAPNAVDVARVVLGVRPESWEIVSAEHPEALYARIELVEELGAEQFVHAVPQNTTATVRGDRVIVRVDHRRSFAVDETIGLQARPEETYWFAPDSGLRLH